MEDSINRNLMIEVFEQELKYQQTEVVHCGSNYKELEGKEMALKWCIDKLKSCPKVNKWIPCSERLPEEDGLYLVTDVSIYFGAYSTYVLKREKASPSNCVKWATIVAWMPLPEPYKEGNNVERDA